MLEVVINLLIDICLTVGNGFLKIISPRQSDECEFSEMFSVIVGVVLLLLIVLIVFLVFKINGY
jgi:hypothetical protein